MCRRIVSSAATGSIEHVLIKPGAVDQACALAPHLSAGTLTPIASSTPKRSKFPNTAARSRAMNCLRCFHGDSDVENAPRDARPTAGAEPDSIWRTRGGLGVAPLLRKAPAALDRSRC